MNQATVGRSRLSGDGVAVLPVAWVLVVALSLIYIITRPPAAMHTWVLVGDIDIAAALLLCGSLIFPLATAFACRIEGVKTPRLIDHFRQCSILYLAVALGALALVLGNESRGSLGYSVGGVTVVAAFIGVLANALTLMLRAIRARAT